MELARVLGQVVSTVKEPGLDKFTLLLLQDTPDPGSDAGGDPGGGTFVAVDLVGAGVGEVVLVVRGGAARVAAGADIPTDRAVVGIADSVIRGGTVTYRKS